MFKFYQSKMATDSEINPKAPLEDQNHQENNGTRVPLISEPLNGKLSGKLEPIPEDNTDTSEIDPCLEESKEPQDVKLRKMPFYDKHLSGIQKKTGLSRKWVLIVICLALMCLVMTLVIIGLVIGWPRIPHMFKYPICRNTGCLKAASQLQENLDSSVSPCTDLWGAVCSKYTTNSSRPLDRPIWNQKQIILQKEFERIRNMISTLDVPVHTGTVDWKLKYLYQGCLDVDTLANYGATPLINIISKLGGWFALREWTEEDFDAMRLLTDLQVKFGISPFFKVHVEPDPHTANTHIIRISPSGLGLPDKSYYYRDSEDAIVNAYIEYIRDVVISLSSTKHEADKFAKDMFNYEKRLAEITPDLGSLLNPITTFNLYPLEELKNTVSTIPFYNILQTMYPEVTITDATEVVVTSTEYLNQLAQIISTTDRRTMNSYLIWTLVREYVPFLSDHYTSATDSFNKALFGISKSNKRWEICSKLVRKHMALAAEQHLENSFPISENTRNIVNDTFKTILYVVKEKLSESDSSDLLMQHLESKLNTLTIQIGLPPSTSTSQFLKDYYSALKILKFDLFEGIQSAIMLEKRVEEKMLLNSLPEGMFLRELLREEPLVRYIPSKNAIVVPRSLVMEPWLEEGYPRPIVYGRLGVEIASAILSAILPYGSLWKSDRKILSQFHTTGTKSIDSVQPSISCLSRAILKTGFVNASRLNETALTVLKEIASVKIAQEALFVASNSEEHRHYGGVEQYEESSLFFLGFAQMQCSESTQQYQLYENLLQFNVPSRYLLDLSWMQLPDFKKAFNCALSNSKRCNTIF